MIFLQGYGISTLFAVKMYKTYGDQCIPTLSGNPYCLASDIYGIGFFSADRIALAMGVGRDSPARAGAGIRHVLQASRDEGHCFLTEDQILKNCRELLDIDNHSLIQRVLKQLLEAHEIKKRALTSGEGATTECYYSNSLYFDEAYVSKKIAQFVQTFKTCCPQNASRTFASPRYSARPSNR
jgi:exodeoxyribonuclease V alpha subunit